MPNKIAIKNRDTRAPENIHKLYINKYYISIININITYIHTSKLIIGTVEHKIQRKDTGIIFSVPESAGSLISTKLKWAICTGGK